MLKRTEPTVRPDHPLTESERKTLRGRPLIFVRLDYETAQELLKTRLGGHRFSIMFRHRWVRPIPTRSVALFAVDDGTVWLGVLRSKGAVGTLESRLLFDFVEPIFPHSLKKLLAGVSNKQLKPAISRLKQSDDPLSVVPSGLAEALIDALVLDDSNAFALRRIAAELSRSTAYRDARAMQQDAIRLALKAFGADEADSIRLTGPSAIGTVRLHEDAVIEHDARYIPGWMLSGSDVTGRAIFTKSDERLEVFTANRRALEQLLGVDLIYFNSERRSLVMVQYKMMEGHSAGPLRVPIDAQFEDEIDRMKRLDEDLSPDGPYRLHPGVFYLKFVRRNASAHAAGILMSLGHFEHLRNTGGFTGLRGGLRLDYGDLRGHYLRGEGFVELVRSGYIGSRGATTEHLQTLVDAALNNDRGVVAAIQSALDE